MEYIDSLRNDYDRIRPAAERFLSFMQEQLHALIRDSDLILGMPIEARVKDWASIAAKVKRHSLNLPQIERLTDLVGLRLIFLFNRDVETVCGLIETAFRVVSAEDVSKRLAEAKFGYQSRHLGVKVHTSWQTMPALRGIGELQAEVQVRTVAQHIWAAASHKLQYKREASVPLPVRRAIHRVAALLEVVDLEFERVLQDRQSYSAEASHESTGGPLNVDNLSAILTAVLPAQNKDDNGEDYDELLVDLRHFKVTTVGGLRELLTRHKEAMAGAEASQLRLGQTIGTTPERAKQGVFFTHVGLARQALHSEFGEDFERYITEQSYGITGDFDYLDPDP